MWERKNNRSGALEKTFAFFLCLSVFLTGTIAYAEENTSPPPQESQCLKEKWSLVWTHPPAGKNAGDLVTSEDNELVLENPITLAYGLEPVLPQSLSGKAQWKNDGCAQYGASGTTSEKEDVPPGMELCMKAAELAAKAGGYASVDYLQEGIKDSALDFLSEKLGGITGINVNLNASDLFSAAGGFLQNKFNELFGNELKSEVNKKMEDLKKEIKKELEDIGKKFIEDKAKDLVDTATGILGAGVSAVPTEEKGKLLDEATLIRERTAEIIVEQKKQQIIDKKRAECKTLYDTTVDTIKRTVLYQLSNQITDWITTGEKPQFLTQPGKFLEDTAYLAADRFISQVAPRLCEPFRLGVTIQIPTTDRRANPFYEQVTCTLDRVTSNIENFYNDFRDGGWIAYQEMWKPQNNFFGASMMARNELAAQQASIAQAIKEDVSAGQGFTSTAQCTEWRLYKPTTPPSGTVYSSIDRVLRMSSQGEYFEWDKDPASTYGPTDDGLPPPLPESVPPDSYWQCERSEVTQPGIVASGLSQRASQIDIDYAQNVSSGEIENFLKTIENAIINKLVKSGVKGLRNLLKGLPILDL